MRVHLETFQGGRLRLIAHRGGRGFGEDNTLAAMERAVREGVRMLETDVRMTADGELVICHDATLRGRMVSRMTLEELRRYAPERPLLVDLMEELAGWVTFDIEVKDASMRRLAEVLEAYRVESGTLVTSFNAEFLEGFQELYPSVKTGHVYRLPYGIDRKIERALQIGAEVILPYYGSVERELVDEAHQAGLEVYIWTVNEEDDFRRFHEWGVDGIITDRYHQMEDLLQRL
jgi:glycerophosphoryl diester phosphodiesterase